jgi:hypothetical protein
MRFDAGRFEDEDPEPIEEVEPETPHTWDEADEGDRRYDIWAEQQMDRHTWPENADTWLRRMVTPAMEDEMERDRREAA